MNRIDRLSAILIQLQSRRIIKAQDIADRFNISLRTVYRDVRSLEEAGVPIIGEAGVGYSLMEGYRLPPVMFTQEEAMAFITAEKLVSSLTDAENTTSYNSALYKVKAVLRTAEKDYIANLDDRIQVFKSCRPATMMGEISNLLQTILKAISEKMVIRLHYFAYHRNQHTKREVEPIGIFYLDNYWHFIAWCRERKACRDFRFDRITQLVLTEEKFVDVHHSLKEYINTQYKEVKLTEVTLLVDQEAYRNLGEQKYYQGYLNEKEMDTGIEMNFLTTSVEGFARWFLSFADYARVIRPKVLLDRVKEIHAAAGNKF